MSRYHIKTLPDVENGQTCECGAPAVGIFPEPVGDYWMPEEARPLWPKDDPKPYCRACLEKIRQDIMQRYSP